MEKKLRLLANELKGELFFNDTMRRLYATDASAYREMPLAVAIPQNESDIQQLIAFAHQNETNLIPRTAGTSLAGQVVGNGIVVDVSKNFTKILEVNKEASWVRVEPGVVRDELNMHLKEFGLFFGPETSTANRAMIGGMVGNNSCGSNSIVYGSTRDHVLSLKGFLSDGSLVEFKDISLEEFNKKKAQKDLEGEIYRKVFEILSNETNQKEIIENYPKPSIRRRNTGYALDMLLAMSPFKADGKAFNFCELISGSEGTLMFITEIKLHVDPTPPKYKGLVCVHHDTIDEALNANLISLKYDPSAVELIDHYVLECTKESLSQRENRFFVEGEPGAILVTEISRHTEEELDRDIEKLIAELKAQKYGFHYPIVKGADIKKVWNLRKAGLGLLSNIPGDAKPVAVIEDTAVDVRDLPSYIAEFNQKLKERNLYCVHYAHAGSGELHLRPIIDLKTAEGNQLFKAVATDIAELVKKYKGSLSGEHGDGRLRGEFIPFMIGEKNYKLLEEVKNVWDPKNILNPNKIVKTPAMNSSLRYMPGYHTPDFKTVFDFSKNKGLLRSAELCNGSGDCRKTELSGGTMCPSYMASKNEKETTRARANILREFLSNSEIKNPFEREEVLAVLDLCLSCKGCKSECPSNVDMAKMKAEYIHQYYKAKGKIPTRTKMIANFSKMSALAAMFPRLSNLFITAPITSDLFKSVSGFAPERSVPTYYKITLLKWYLKHSKALQEQQGERKKVYLFNDEFTNYNDTTIGIKAIELLERLGYEVVIPKHIESGRTYLSKGILEEAKNIAVRNIELLKNLISEETPLVGIEPSAILTFRDEYKDLCHDYQKEDAAKLAKFSFTFEEFIAREVKAGNIRKDQFTKASKLMKLHGHCHQKALSSLTPSKIMLELPENYKVHIIPSGCCGMAGSFGYEKEHYEISMKIGELVLFPTIRKQPEDVLIVAAGTSCRHQIKDGTDRVALHPIEVLYDALV